MIEIVREQREETIAFERIGATYKLPVTFVAIRGYLYKGKTLHAIPKTKGREGLFGVCVCK